MHYEVKLTSLSFAAICDFFPELLNHEFGVVTRVDKGSTVPREPNH